MERYSIKRQLATLVSSALIAGVSIPANADGLRDSILGSWQLVSLTVVQGEKKIDLFGEGARGMQAMLPDGRFMNLITREVRRGDTVIELQPLEFSLLEYLLVLGTLTLVGLDAAFTLLHLGHGATGGGHQR